LIIIVTLTNTSCKEPKQSENEDHVLINQHSNFIPVLTHHGSPIDELGEGAYENGWWCHVKCRPRVGPAGPSTTTQKADCRTKARFGAQNNWVT